MSLDLAHCSLPQNNSKRLQGCVRPASVLKHSLHSLGDKDAVNGVLSSVLCK